MGCGGSTPYCAVAPRELSHALNDEQPASSIVRWTVSTNDPQSMSTSTEATDPVDYEPAFAGLAKADDPSWGIAERVTPTDALATPMMFVQTANEEAEGAKPCDPRAAPVASSRARSPCPRALQRSRCSTSAASLGEPVLPPASKPRQRTSYGAVPISVSLPSLAFAEFWTRGGCGLISNLSGASLTPSSGLVERYATPANYAELQWGPATRSLTGPLPQRSLAFPEFALPVSGMVSISQRDHAPTRIGIRRLVDGRLV
ncbi:hypothetical protein T492DRAFT_850356 [Pavlovales sp. CCMP2436]|nr:hypothetical protein T492DRAFT_850356 [Pavlovales sp. CCMP2436]